MDYLKEKVIELGERLGARDYYERSNQGERQSCGDGELERKLRGGEYNRKAS